ncbi:Hint domain-containing protein [uncultured Tateyamaria sp.]|uniref:Hint domain-containing protein n=1 Tax=uncultured Tateyamaria sp. TaxID=455651 RepID=UPI002630FAFA|nr:Hint domain-containing protein [uncultured Tateyamaria sp.]
MSFTFYAENNEFAAATGSNVNSGDGTSSFDYPPTSTLDLQITTHPDDDDPRHFEVGDRVSLSFQGNGGTTLSDAVVIRSDPIGGNKGAIVFEGTNPQGQLVQVVWSPNFDLEQWYYDNFDAGRSPGFYNYDRNAEDYRFSCFASGTMIDTADGPVPVEDIRQGDLVRTRDGGVEPVLWTAKSVVPGMGRGAPVTIQPGLLGAKAPVTVTAQHRLLIADPRCEPYFGVNEVLVAAGHLVDGVGITRENAGMTTYHHLLFERHEIVQTAGLFSESLLLGDDMRGVMSDAAYADFERTFAAPFPKSRAAKPARRILRRFEAPVIRTILKLGQSDETVKPPTFFFAA